MTAERVLRLHSEGFNRALTQQDYDALEGIYSEMYMLVRPDGSVATPLLYIYPRLRWRERLNLGMRTGS
jgi:hypothetical protein